MYKHRIETHINTALDKLEESRNEYWALESKPSPEQCMVAAQVHIGAAQALAMMDLADKFERRLLV